MHLVILILLSVCTCSILASPLTGKVHEEDNDKHGTDTKISEIKAKMTILKELLDKLDDNKNDNEHKSELHEKTDEGQSAASGQDTHTEAQEDTEVNKRSKETNPNEASMLKELEMALKKMRTRQQSASPVDTGETPGKFLDAPVELQSRKLASQHEPEDIHAVWREAAKRLQNNQRRFYVDPVNSERQEEYEERQLQTGRDRESLARLRLGEYERQRLREEQEEEALAQVRLGEYERQRLREEQEKEALAQVRLGVLHAIETQLLEDIQVAEKYGFTVDDIINDLEQSDKRLRQRNNFDTFYYKEK